MPALCRDCLSWFDRDPGARCPNCSRPRMVRHAELGQLSIAHLDCDAFYASVEKRDNPALADTPVIVGGGTRGVVSTCCYLARIAGVRSAMPMFQALELCPEAVVIRPRMEVYGAIGRRIRQAMTALTPMVEPLALDEAFLDLSGTERMLGAPPALAMARLVAGIERDFGLTVSVGLSHNKYLAKTASELDKPRGFAVIGRAETLAFLEPRPVRSIWGGGEALAQRLEADGLRTHADLRGVETAELIARYGRIGKRLADLAVGIDNRRVNANQPVKSVSSETTFDTDLANPEPLVGHLWRLCVLTSDRAKAKDIGGAQVQLKLKSADFRILTRQVRLPAATNSVEAIFRAANPLLLRETGQGPFRLMGVSLAALGPVVAGGDLFGGAEARVESATDQIRARFGKDAIIRGRSWR